MHKRFLWLFLAIPLLILAPSLKALVAPEMSAADTSVRLAKLEQQTADAKSSADNCFASSNSIAVSADAWRLTLVAADRDPAARCDLDGGRLLVCRDTTCSSHPTRTGKLCRWT